MTLIQADILDWCKTYTGPKFHASIQDAPYELREIPPEEIERALEGEATKGKGFMGRSWDGDGLVFNPRLWEAIAAHLLPGAYIFVFGGTLNDDLISLAMRRAGLRKHHKALAWSYGSGFPKATRISEQVDRAAGAERPIIGQRQHAPKFAAKDFGYREKDNGYNSRERESFAVTAPATPLAAAWQGHRYGLQALKPAVEPILVFQKPYQGRPVDCITATGAGAINIDGGRIGDSKRVPGSLSQHNGGALGHLAGLGVKSPDHSGQNPDIGRWPANLALVHSPQCGTVCAPECAVRRLGEQSGELTSGRLDRASIKADNQIYGKAPKDRNGIYEADSGTAARFFFNGDYAYERLEESDPVGYYAKASSAEREAGLGDFTPTIVSDGRDKSIDNAYLRGETQRRNTHPTIKPLSLIKWLATLLLPPVEYAPRRLLIPFAGVASEMIGAHLAGWEEVTGIEREADHVAIGQARLTWWQEQARRFGASDPATILEMARQHDPDQFSIFDLEAA